MKQTLIDVNRYLKKVCTYKETGCGSCKLQTMCPKYAPEVDAIPVEWIKKWLNKRPLYEDSVCELLEDWRKEKER